MKIPLKWIKEFVRVDADPAELSERLTMAGLEVTGFSRVGAGFENVVVGEVAKVTPHPNADRLSLCDVNIGSGIARVVCGAPNVRAGDKAPFAAIGAELPNGLAVRKAKIRGEPSFGMLCAEDELGFSDDHSSLMSLPSDIPAGTPFSDVTGVPDYVFSIEITPNRPDCLSVIGVAREVAAIYGLALNREHAFFSPSCSESGAMEGGLSIRVENASDCPRYNARILRGIKLAPSSPMMRMRLINSGVRAINNIVDITNYVMLECGQPLHAFDLAKLDGLRINVRRAKQAETIVTLDGSERVLDPSVLVIAGEKAPVAIAGVMGGEGSGVATGTRDILLESACFNPALIRRSSKSLGLSSESSRRFERGADIMCAARAGRRSLALMALNAGASDGGWAEFFPNPPAEKKIAVRFDRVSRLLGMDITGGEITRLLSALEISAVETGPGGCVASPPSFRYDLETEVDIAEEIARLHGLDKIKQVPPAGVFVEGPNDDFIRSTIACRSALAALGLTEIMNYSMVSPKLLGLFKGADSTRRIVLPRPVSSDQSILRDALLPQMMETLGRNRSRQISAAAFFEIGRVFFKSRNFADMEEERLSIGLMGSCGASANGGRREPEEEEMFLWLKGIMVSLCRKLFTMENEVRSPGDKSGLSFIELKPDLIAFPIYHECFERGRAVALAVDGEPIGAMGLMGKAQRREWRLDAEPVAIMEARLAPLLKRAKTVPMAERPSVFPSVSRDISLRVSSSALNGDIVAAMWKAAPKELTAVELFDIFTGDGILSGFKSMAYSLTYRADDRTLTDEEVNRLHEALKSRLLSEISAEVREG